jgi:hypothetical protein
MSVLSLAEFAAKLIASDVNLKSRRNRGHRGRMRDGRGAGERHDRCSAAGLASAVA